MQPWSGNLYGSSAIGGYDSRALREAEFHVRAKGHGFDCRLEWVPIPVLRDLEGPVEEDAANYVVIESWPVLLPSALATFISDGNSWFIILTFTGPSLDGMGSFINHCR